MLAFRTHPELDRLIDRLRSEEIALREAAQKQIEKIGPAVAPELRDRISVETDPEVRERLSDSLRTMERRLARQRLEDCWAGGDVDGALRQLALLEGARDPAGHILARKKSIRERLQDAWGEEGGCSLGRSRSQDFEAWVVRLQVDRCWVMAVLLEYVSDEEHNRWRARSTLIIVNQAWEFTPVLIPLLRRPDALSREMGCILLSYVRDERAAAELERVCRNREE